MKESTLLRSQSKTPEVLSKPERPKVLKDTKKKGVLPDYPADHQVGMKVPKGGSACFKCEYEKNRHCRQEDWVRWNGSNWIPQPVDEYCCDFFEPR